MSKNPSGEPVYYGMRIYRVFFRCIFSVFGRFLVGRERWKETTRLQSEFAALPDVQDGEIRIWFHAASVGELESLWPLVERAARDPEVRLFLSVFSSSAKNHLHKMARKLEGRPPLYVGYSPLEGGWKDAFREARPKLFVTAKYEAWPEVWHEIAVHGITLALVGAKPRSSILWAKRILRIIRGRIPNMIFFSFDSENEPGLAKSFPAAEILHGADPRWDRVFQRSEYLHPRVTELVQEFRDLPRPWGVIGSAWSSDLRALPEEAATTVEGTLWIVPHRTDPRSLSEIEILIRDHGYTPVRSSTPERIRPAGRIAVLVDEMGFLAELYSQMDWAFVGGGFGSSIHSTIEPAIYGLPIYGGPKGQTKFDEIILLKKQSQLHIAGETLKKGISGGGGEDFLSWFRSEVSLPDSAREARRREWKAANLKNRGASDRIWDSLVRIGRAR